MKAKDLNVGVIYAVNERGLVSRARLVEVRIPKASEHKVYSGARWDFSGHQAMSKMAHVEFLRSDGSVSLDTWVALTQIETTWINHTQFAQKKAERDNLYDRGLTDLEDAVYKRTGKSIRFARETIPGNPAGYALVSTDVIRALLGDEDNA